MEYLARVELKLYADDPLTREKLLVCIAMYLLYSLKFHIGWRLNHFILFYVFLAFFASGFTLPSVISKALVFLYPVSVFTTLSTLPLRLKTTYFPCQSLILPSKSSTAQSSLCFIKRSTPLVFEMYWRGWCVIYFVFSSFMFLFSVFMLPEH